MLYILPPPSAPSPPSPWSSIVCNNNTSNSSPSKSNQNSSSNSHKSGSSIATVGNNAQPINGNITFARPSSRRSARYQALCKFRNRFVSVNF